jgi:lipoate---protein ligase
MSERGATDLDIWRRLPDSDEPMDWQLAYTEALFSGLEAGSGPTLRWYRTAVPALVLGRSQHLDRADVAAASATNTAIYGRTSGGGAVYIDEHALSLDVSLPAGHPLALHDVTLSYRPFGEIWADALRRLGIPTARALPTDEARALAALPADEPLRLACYGTLSPWEIVVDGRKVVGLSQVRRRPGAVLAMGVHLHWEPAKLVRLLALTTDERDRLTSALRRTTSGLDVLTDRTLTASDVAAAFEASLAERLGVRFIPGDWLPQERDTARRFHLEHRDV